MVVHVFKILFSDYVVGYTCSDNAALISLYRHSLIWRTQNLNHLVLAIIRFRGNWFLKELTLKEMINGLKPISTPSSYTSFFFSCQWCYFYFKRFITVCSNSLNILFHINNNILLFPLLLYLLLYYSIYYTTILLFPLCLSVRHILWIVSWLLLVFFISGLHVPQVAHWHSRQCAMCGEVTEGFASIVQAGKWMC